VTARLLALLPLAALLTAGPAAGQNPGRLPYGGSEVFRFALYKHGLKPLSDPAEAFDRPPESVIVIVGDPSRVDRLLPGIDLITYLNKGGSILVATDGPVPAAGANWANWANLLGIRITGEPLSADPKDSYRGEPPRPFVKPTLGVVGGRQSPHYLFEDVDATGPAAVAADRPCAMSLNRNPLQKFLIKPLATYPATARSRDGRMLADTENHFAVSLQPVTNAGNSPGRVIVLADHGVLVNGMMGFVKDPAAEKGYRFDNGNWAFANRTIEWLTDGFPQPRSACLFIEDGRIIDRFAVELPPNPQPPMPNIPPDVIANWVLNHANGIIDEKQEQDVFNRALERSLGLPRLLRVFLIAATVAFVVVGLRWLLRGQRKPDAAAAAAAMTPAARDGLLPRGGVVRQRTGAQLEVGNLYEAARRRVRERFDVLGGRPGPAGEMPPVLTANDLADGPLLHQSVRWLWVLGYGDTPVAVPPADWDRTNVLLERVTARAARGDWSFGQDAD
jgi:hypothetical protein